MARPVSPTDAARRWAVAWKDGWEALDAEAIIARYSEDAIVSTQPFREPCHGLAGIREYTRRVFAEEREPRVWMSEPIVQGDRASVSWWASLVDDGQEATLAGTSVLRFDAAGLVVEQWDTWNHRPGGSEPPDPAPFAG